jgi:hypothetical protein
MTIAPRQLKTIKSLFVVLLTSYLIVTVIYFFRFELSYQIINVRPDLVEIRDLTNSERDSLDKAQNIRISISNIFLGFSIAVAILSFIMKKIKVYSSVRLINIIIAVGIFWSIILVLVKGIHFIPTGPLV